MPIDHNPKKVKRAIPLVIRRKIHDDHAADVVKVLGK